MIDLLLLLAILYACVRRPLRTRRTFRSHPAACSTIRSRQKPIWATEEIIRLKALTDQSCYKLAATFNRMYATKRQVTVGKTWVAEVVRNHRYEIADLRLRYKRNVPRQQATNEVWGLDFTGKGCADGIIIPIIGIIDHGSRLALALQPVRNRTALTSLRVLLATMDKFGIPEIIRSDNESAFTSALFRFAMRWLGVRHQRSEAGCPWQNGRIERLFGTLKAKLDMVVALDFISLQAAMVEFRQWYNHVRPHQHLHGWTPAEVWNDDDPYAKPARSAHYFAAWNGLLEGIHIRR